MNDVAEESRMGHICTPFSYRVKAIQTIEVEVYVVALNKG